VLYVDEEAEELRLLHTVMMDSQQSNSPQSHDSDSNTLGCERRVSLLNRGVLPGLFIHP
jgi:hypothetical protein